MKNEQNSYWIKQFYIQLNELNNRVNNRLNSDQHAYYSKIIADRYIRNTVTKTILIYNTIRKTQFNSTIEIKSKLISNIETSINQLTLQTNQSKITIQWLKKQLNQIE